MQTEKIFTRGLHVMNVELLLFPMPTSLPHTPSSWDLCKHGATIGFDGKNDWKTCGETEEMDRAPFGAQIFLRHPGVPVEK